MKVQHKEIKNWKHWEIHFNHFMITRWCEAAPCHLTKNKRHPIRLYRLS